MVRAIRKDVPEIVVTPGPGRLMMALMDLFPTSGPVINRLPAANATLGKLQHGRRDGGLATRASSTSGR